MHQIAAGPGLFGADPIWVATIVFVLTYVLVITDRINRSIIAMLGAGAMIVAGVLTQDEAIRGIDFNTIALLTGMMVLVAIGRRCGMFEYLAVWSAKKGRAQPWAMLAMLSLVTAIVSAFLDNVTTVLLIAPVTLAVTRRLETPPYPFLFAEVFASNIGGTATLIGDPILMLFHNLEHHRDKEKQTLRVTETFGEVDWITIFFFIGLFVIVHGVDVAGVIETLARRLMAATGADPTATAVAILWGSAI